MAIFPENRPELVNALIDVIYDKPEPGQLFNVETLGNNEGEKDEFRKSFVLLQCTETDTNSRKLLIDYCKFCILIDY